MKELEMLKWSDGVSLVDGHVEVTHEEATQAARDLARFEGIFSGYSAGANVAAAMQLLRTKHPGGTVAVLICDSGLWDDHQRKEEE